MQIPMGNFNQARAVPAARESRVDMGSLDNTSGYRAIAQGLGVAADVANNMALEDQQEKARMAAAKAYIASQQYELDVSEAQRTVVDDMAMGLDYNKAEETFTQRADAIPPPKIEGLPPAAQVEFEGRLGLTKQRYAGVVRENAVRARKEDGTVQFDTLLNNSELLAAKGNPEEVVTNMKKAGESFALGFGLDPSATQAKLQSRSERIWSNDVAQKYNASSNDLVALRELEKAVSADDGYYADKLDATKRTVLVSEINRRIDSLEGKAVRDADKADKISEKARNDYEKQVLNGLPGTLEQKEQLTSVYGAASPEEKAKWDTLFQTEHIVQQVIKQPLEQQAVFIRDLTAKAKTQEDKDNVDRLTTTINANIAMATKNPVQWLNGPGGDNLPPLKVEMMADPSQAGELYANISDRYNSISTMQKNYGAQVKMNLLTPDELAGTVAVMAKMNPDQKIKTLASLQTRVGGMAYQALIKQIAPEDPVLAKAGELGAINRTYRPDYSAEARAKISSNVALTMLNGHKMIADSKGSTAIDALMPSEDKFRKFYMETVGNAYANNPAALEENYAAAKAYFVGRQSEVGGVSDKGMKNDQRLIKESILAVSGRVVERNDYKTFAPYGMDEDTFSDKADVAIRTALAGLPDDQRESLADRAGLIKAPDGRYALVYGKTIYRNQAGKIVYVSIK